MAAEDAQKSAVTGNTNKEQARAWLRWQKFLKSIELENDDFLEGFPQNQRVRLLSAFAQSVRNGEYSSSSFDSLASSTVNSTVDYVASTFRDNQFPDPRLDDFGKPSRILSKQYKGYKNNEKPAQQQKALPLCVINQLTKNKSTDRAKALSDLAISAFFFAMRSCEYLKVSCKEEDRKTKRLRVRNVRFFRDGRELSKKDPTLQSADFVSVTFEDQKNDEKEDTITMQFSGDHILCPVRSLARIVKRILSYPDSDEEMFLCTFRSRSKFYEVSGDDLRNALRAAASVFGEDKLGFKIKDIGTHSIRSGAAMAMYLDEVSIYIQLCKLEDGQVTLSYDI